MAVPYSDLWEFVPLTWTTGFDIEHLQPGEGQFWYPSFDNAPYISGDETYIDDNLPVIPLHSAA